MTTLNDNLRVIALELATQTSGPAADVVERAFAYFKFLAGDEAAPAEDKPKRVRAKAEPAAAETPAPSKLEPADEGKVETKPEEPSADGAAASADEKPAGPTRDDALTAATKFSQLSAAQGGGADALEKVLRQFGALDGDTPRFSKLTEAQYGDFIAEMKKREDKGASSALS